MEEGERLGVVAQVMDEVDLCGRCGSDLSRRGVARSVSVDTGSGTVETLLCRRCADEEAAGEFERSGAMTGDLLTSAVMARARHPGSLDEREARIMPSLMRVAEAYDRILAAVRGFEERVWLGGMGRYVHECPSSSMSAESGGLEMLTMVLGGRAVLTLRLGNTMLTVIAEDGSAVPTMGVQGISAAEDQAVDLLARAESAWGSGVRLAADGSVGPT